MYLPSWNVPKGLQHHLSRGCKTLAKTVWFFASSGDCQNPAPQVELRSPKWTKGLTAAVPYVLRFPMLPPNQNRLESKSQNADVASPHKFSPRLLNTRNCPFPSALIFPRSDASAPLATRLWHHTGAKQVQYISPANAHMRLL